MISCCGVRMVPMWHRGKLKGWQCVGKCKKFHDTRSMPGKWKSSTPRHTASKSRKAVKLYENLDVQDRRM